MNDQVTEIMESAMMKEVASAAMYRQAAADAAEPAAATLLRELADEEEKHLAILKDIPPRQIADHRHPSADLSRPALTTYLKAPDELPGADLPGTILFAIRQEAASASFYRELAASLTDSFPRSLADSLADQELEHQSSLEKLYQDIVYIED
jgi:rubrerythrin